MQYKHKMKRSFIFIIKDCLCIYKSIRYLRGKNAILMNYTLHK